MNKENDVVSKIDTLLKEIKNLGSCELQTLNESEDIPTLGQKNNWRMNFSLPLLDYIDNFKRKIDLYDINELDEFSKKLESFKNQINDALELINNINSYNQIKADTLIKNLIEKINDLYISDGFHLKYPENLENYDINELLNILNPYLSESDDKGYIVNFIINSDDVDKKIYIIRNLIEIYNLQLDSSTLQTGRKIERIFQKTLQSASPSNHQRAAKLLEETEAMVAKGKETLGLKDNLDLLMIFKNESNQLQEKIDNLNTFIIALLSLIIIGFLSMIINKIFPVEFKHYIFYVSLLFVTSALLAYLIKDRSRLIELQDYCKRMYMEITALPEYMNTLTDEQNKDLRILLAPNYFTGNLVNNTSNPQKDLSSTLTTLESFSKIMQNFQK